MGTQFDIEAQMAQLPDKSLGARFGYPLLEVIIAEFMVYNRQQLHLALGYLSLDAYERRETTQTLVVARY